MKVKSLKNQYLQPGSPGSLTLTDSRTGLPLIGSSIWLSLNEFRYSESTVRKHLFAIGKFYKHVDKVEQGRIDLDQMLLSCNVIKLTEHLRSFMAFIQNSGAQTRINSSGSFRRVVHFVIDTVTELSHRLGKTPKEIQVIHRDLSRLQSLYDFLRPNKKVDIARVRSIPGAVLSEIFELVDPISKSKFWVQGEIYKRRVDIVGFVNGIPLLHSELKAPDVSVKRNYDDNLRAYLTDIPQFFTPNGLVILSNGTDTRLGSAFAPWNHFFDWKKVDSESEQGVVSMETVLRGTCSPERLLDIIENFTVFEAERLGTIKKVAKNHQYLGVTNALRAVLALKDQG